MKAYIPQLTLQSCWAFFKNQKGDWMPQQSCHHFNDGIVCYSSSQAPVISTAESSKTLYYRWYPYLTHASSADYSSAFLPNFQLVISLFVMPINALYLLIPISHFTLIYTCTYSIHIHTVHNITCIYICHIIV